MLLVPFFRGFARQLSFVCLAIATAGVGFAQNSALATDGYDPNVDGTVLALAVQPADGKVIVAGQFTRFTPNGGTVVYRNNVARLNTDGSVDESFNADIDAAVRAVLIQPDNKIVIGGDFTTVDGQKHAYVARLNSDGSVDASFTASIGKSLNPLVALPTTPQVLALAYERKNSQTGSDGWIVVGGTFGSASSDGVAAVQRNNLARFTAAGALDLSYDPNPNGIVLALTTAPTGAATPDSILIGGGFTTFKPNGGASVSRFRAARLDDKGVPDSFNPGADDGVTSIKVQRDGMILLGGYFSNLSPNGSSSPTGRVHIARVDAAGNLDANFLPSISGTVNTLAVSDDGSILAGGVFSQVTSAGGVVTQHINMVRLLIDGTPDQTFFPHTNADVNAIVVQPDAKIVVGGSFTRVAATGSSQQEIRNHLVRLLSNGAIDAPFQYNASARILASTNDSKGLIVGGNFSIIGGASRQSLARVLSDGTIDPTYNPYLNGPVYAVAYDPTTKSTIIGGSFTTLGTIGNYVVRSHIARVFDNGTVDAAFDPNIDGPVTALYVLSDGSILVGGQFANAQPNGATTATARANLLKLSSTGDLDPTFKPSTNGAILAITQQASDQKILISGAFTAVQPGSAGTVFSRSYVARLNADGSMDRDFGPVLNGQVNAMVVQPDGKIVLGGQFTAFFQGSGGVSRSHILRLKTDGTLDSAFDPNFSDVVLALALEPSDQKILVGGLFTQIAPNGATTPTDVRYLARLNTDGTLDKTLDVGLNQQLGNRVDFLSAQPDKSVLVGGTFISAQPSGSAVLPREHFLKLTPAGAVDATFTIHPSAAKANTVEAISLQPDARIIVGGLFQDLDGAPGPNLARYAPEGAPDFAFNGALSTDNTVNAIAIRPNSVAVATQLSGFALIDGNGALDASFKPNFQLQGRVNVATRSATTGLIYLAGVMTVPVNGTTANIVRVSANGTLDTSYAPTISGFNSTVTGMLLQPDEKLLIWGEFTTVDGVGASYIARLNPDGTLDTAFNPNPDSVVRWVILQGTDGHMLIGGDFSTLTPVGTTTATSVPYLARLDSGGKIDTTFNPAPNGIVYTLVKQSDGKILLGGTFTSLNPTAATTATTRNRIARLNADLTLDANFDPNVDGIVYAMDIQADGKIVIGGQFSSVGTGTTAVHRSDFARLNTDGTVDSAFNVTPNSTVQYVRVASDGAILIGGSFTSVIDSAGATVARNHVARLTVDGKIDPRFNPALNGSITGIAVLNPLTAQDPRRNAVLIGGTFTETFPSAFAVIGGEFLKVAGQSTPYLAEVNADGSVVGTFTPSPDGKVRALFPLPDGRMLVGGWFTKFAAATSTKAHVGLALFKADGTLDDSFAPSITGHVESVMVQGDGKILAGTDTGLIRLNADGTSDVSFTPGAAFTSAVAIAVQPDGKILVAGPGGGEADRVLRLNANGSVDSSFTKFVVSTGGNIQTLTLQSDGGVIVAGSFVTQSLSNLVRLTSTGAVDTSFNAAPDAQVDSLALQYDGRLLIGGHFSNVGGQTRVALARIGTSATTAQTLGVLDGGKTIQWVRSAAVGQTAMTAGEVASVTFEMSTDASVWTTLGTASRVNGSGLWRLSTNQLPTSGNVYIRARAIVPTSSGKSTGEYESVILYTAGVQTTGMPRVVAPVVSSIPWDESHYVWVIDSSGTMRIADASSLYTYSSTNAVLVDGGGVTVTNAGVSRLANLSTRGPVSATSPLISGFSIVGSSSRSVLIRAVGPGLAPFGVGNYLAAPQLILNSAAQTLATTTHWDASLSATFVRVGAFPFTAGSADAAILVTLNPGTYTVQVTDAGTGAGGDALIEVYDAGDLNDAGARLANLSARATVNASGTLISGLVVTGSTAKTVLIRGVGPGLAGFNVSGVLSDPAIAVYAADGAVIGSNDNWSKSTATSINAVNYASAVTSAASTVGAFPLTTNSTDAALVVTLPAGTYTVQMRGADGGAGAGMIELYEVP